MTAPGRLILTATLLATTAACDLTFPWSSTERRKVDVTVTPASLRFASTTCDAAPAPQILHLTLHRPDGVVLAWIDPPGESAFFADAMGPFEVWVRPAEPASIGSGEHTATLRITATTPAGPVDGERVVAIPLVYSVAPCPLTLEGDGSPLEVLAGMPVPAVRTLTASEPDGAGPWTAAVTDVTCWEVDVAVDPVSGDSLPATLTVTAAPSWAGYVWSEHDCSATVHFARGARETTFPVPIHVVPQTLTFDPPFAVFTAYVGQLEAPPAQTFAVTPTVGPLTYEAQPVIPWDVAYTATGTAPGTFALSMRSTGVVPATYPLGVTFRWAGGETYLTGTYTVLPRSLIASPEEVAFAVDAATTTVGITSAIALTASAAIGWEASADVTWLHVTPPSGTTDAGEGVALTPDLAWLAALPSGSAHATVTVAYSEPNGVATRLTIPVSLSMSLPFVRAGLPRAVVAGAPATLTVGGGDFLSPWTPPTFTVDGGAPVAPSWRLYDLAGVPLPALAPGRHAVTVANALGLDRGAAPFDAVAPTTPAAAAVAAPGHRTQLAFDDARGVLYAANPRAGVVERYLEADGWAREVVTVDGLRDAALSTDGEHVAAVAGGTIRVVDTATFSLAATQPSGALPGADPEARDWRLAFAADGRALVVGASADVQAYGFFDGARVTDAGFGWCGGPVFAAVDGRQIGIACPGHSPPYAPELYVPEGMFWGLGGSLYPPGFDAGLVTFDPALSRVVLLDLRIPGATDTLLFSVGSVYPYTVLPGKLPPTTVAAVVTRDGSRAVTLDGATGNVRVFDLAALPAGAADPLAELGPPGGLAPPARPGGSPVLALSADERTLFVGGDDGVAVVPLR